MQSNQSNKPYSQLLREAELLAALSALSDACEHLNLESRILQALKGNVSLVDLAMILHTNQSPEPLIRELESALWLPLVRFDSEELVKLLQNYFKEKEK